MKLYGYDVDICQICINSEYSETDSEYSGDYLWYESYDNFLGSITPNTSGYPDVVSTLKLAKRGTYYLVWLEYSTGDSFGTSNKGSTLACGIFQDFKSANQLKKAIEDYSHEDYCENSPIKLITSDGQEFEIYDCWTDYFGGLDNVNITEFKNLTKRNI